MSATTPPEVRPFTVDIPDEVLDDMRDRLARTRFLADFANKDWDYGMSTEYLESICDYWLNDFDWRAQERKMNEYSHFITEIEGAPTHFIHEKGKGPDPMPIILGHGYPWTFWDLRKLIGPLTDPESYGGDPADSFDVVVPSLPGFGFSSPLTTTGMNFWRTGDIWDILMKDVLGYPKFAVQGADWSTYTCAWMGHKYSDDVIGILSQMAAPLTIFLEPLPGEEEYNDQEEKEWFGISKNFFENESGYSAIQLTKPQTLATGLNDSPAGLAAWILEMRRNWADSGGGDPEARFTKDELCTAATIYWATQTAGTAARYYYECTHNPIELVHDRRPLVESPTAFAIFPAEVYFFPRSWAERTYNVQRYELMPKGGHFAAAEEPELLLNEIRTFFRDLR
jgi:pimeloyl-ACP methyl ester carboxylesterase